jgi:hypothetical protein
VAGRHRLTTGVLLSRDSAAGKAQVHTQHGDIVTVTLDDVAELIGGTDID